MEKNNKKDFFICHASEDKKEYALPICKALIKEGCWLDIYEIIPGDNIIEKIQDGIKNSRYALILLTENWLKKDWARLEFASLLSRQIRTKSKIVIPVMIADKDLILNEIPLHESINYIQCTTLDDVVARLKELIESDKPQCVSYGYNLLSSGEIILKAD